MRKTLFAGIVLAVIATLAVPTAANAENYVPTGGCTMSPSSVQAGQSGTLTCSPGTFQANEEVTYTVSGDNGSSATLASYRTSGAAVQTSAAHLTKAALADGSSSVMVDVPKNASGLYDITAASASRTVTSSISVVPADAPVKTALATTGISSSQIVALFAWIGGLIVLLALILFFFLLYRRHHSTQG